MAIHNHKVSGTVFYDFWQGHRTAVMVPYKEDYTKWDTLVLSSDDPKWKTLPIYFKISFIEYNGMNETLLHLKH